MKSMKNDDVVTTTQQRRDIDTERETDWGKIPVYDTQTKRRNFDE